MTDPRPHIRPASGYSPISYGDLEPILITIIIIISYLVSAYCIFKLWKKDTGTLKKVSWSIILLLPFIGPVLYGALYEMPRPWADEEKASYDLSRHGDPLE